MGAQARRRKRLARQVAELAWRVTAVAGELDTLRAELRERIMTRALIVESVDGGPAVVVGAHGDRAFAQVVARSGAELVAVELFATVVGRECRVGVDLTVGGDVVAVLESGEDGVPDLWRATDTSREELGES
jgi:hypothetical protein